MDMAQYFDSFLAESLELLQTLGVDLLKLEKEPGNREVFNEILRSTHSLKGMSATMGFKGIAELTHEMESTLILLRDCQVPVTPEVVDLLLQSLDALQTMMDGVEFGREGDHDCQPLREALKKLQETGVQPLAEALPARNGLPPAGAGRDDGQANCDLEALQAALCQGYRAYLARFALAPHTVMKAVRVYMVFKAIEDRSAEIIRSEPPVQDLEEEKFDRHFDIVFVTREPVDTFAGALGGISEVSLLALDQVDPEQLLHQNDISPQMGMAGVGPEGRASQLLRTVRVNTERLDSLLNLVGELVINRTRLERISDSIRNPDLQDALEHTGRLMSEMQSIVMKIRMVPIEQVFNCFPRMVRDLSRSLNKNIEFRMEGGETEIDRTVLDEIGEPLVHLIRNAVDHGIELPEERLMAGKPETAIITLAARQDGNNVVIEVTDDGRGIDLEQVHRKAVENGLLAPDEGVGDVEEATLLGFLFNTGFSTVESVTDISGRGVGMDVVKTKVEALNGRVELETRTGLGTTARIMFPVTLAIIRAMLVQIADEQYAIPMGVIDEIALITPDRIRNVHKTETMLLHGRVLPLLRLSRLLQAPHAGENQDESFVVVVRKGEQQYGLVVDTLSGLQDVVIKPLGKVLKGTPGLAGATILGDGQVSLILAVDSLF